MDEVKNDDQVKYSSNWLIHHQPTSSLDSQYLAKKKQIQTFSLFQKLQHQPKVETIKVTLDGDNVVIAEWRIMGKWANSTTSHRTASNQSIVAFKHYKFGAL